MLERKAKRPGLEIDITNTRPQSTSRLSYCTHAMPVITESSVAPWIRQARGGCCLRPRRMECLKDRFGA